MNAPVLLAQLSGVLQPDSSPKTLKVEKPPSGQALIVHLDGNTRIDFSDVASEKLTFVRVGDKLIVLFDNQSTVTIDPVFDSSGHPLADVAFEMTPDHTLTGDQFTALFPITTDQSVLPAAGASGPAAGANFSDPPPVDPLSVGNPLGLLGAGFNQGNLAGHPSDVAPPPHVPVAEPDIATVVEAGIHPTNVPFAGTPVATGNVLTNDVTIDVAAVKVISGVAAGVESTASGNVGATLAGVYGTLVMNADGSFTYTLDNSKANPLAQGQQANDVFTYTMNDSLGDSSTTTLTIDVIGTDDRPVIAPADKAETAPTIVEVPLTTGSATPDVQTGMIHFSDPDLTDRPTATVAAQTATYIAADGHTVLTLTATELAAIEQAFTVANASGTTNTGAIAWTYSIADSALDFLAKNETVTLVSTVVVDDHNGGTDTATVTVTLQGSDDKPVIDVGVTDAVTEQAGKTLSLSHDTVPVTVHFTDPDLDNVGHTAAVTGVSASGVTGGILPGGLGTAELLSFFHIDNVTKAAGSSDGDINATFSAPDLAFDYLAAGEKLTITYTLLLNDHAGGTDTQTVSVVVTGTNDAPTFVSGPETSLLKEDVNVSHAGNLHSQGALVFADVDLSDTHTVATSLTASYSGGTVPIPDSVLESAFSTTLNDSTGTALGSVGWNFALADSLVQSLAQGETLTLTYDVTVTDENLAAATQAVEVIIHGTNDAPVITSGPESATLAELPNTTGSSVQDATSPMPTGTLNFTDVDLNDTHTVAVSVASAVWSGGPNIPVATEADLLAALSTTLHDSNGTGSGSVDWSFAITDKDLDFLNQGETLTVTYDVEVKDTHSGVSTPQTVTVTITGAEDHGFLYFSGDGSSGQLAPDLFRLDVNNDLTSIPVNPPNGSSAGEDGGFIQFANDLYFFAHKDGVGDVLFKLDASGVAVAVLDGDGNTIAEPGGNAHFTIYDGSLYLGADVSGHGDTLVQIDPTGAVHVVDTIAVDPQSNTGFYPGETSGFAQFDGSLYFSALDTDGASDPVLFKLGPDGTLAHVDFQGGSLPDAGIDGGFATFNGGLFFNASDSALFGFDVLFTLDANGNPTPVLDAFGGELFDLGGGPANFHVFDGSLYLTAISFEFALDPGFTETLFKVDANGSVGVLDYQGSQFDFTAANGHLGGLVDFDGKLFFSADTQITDAALAGSAAPVLFSVDGSGNATAVTDSSGNFLVNAGEDGGFVTFNGHQYFFANDPNHSAALFEMDASDNVTLVLDPTNPGNAFTTPDTNPAGQPGADAHFTVFDGSLYFEAQTGEGTELVQIDSSGVARVIDVNPDAGPPPGDGFPGEDGGFGVYTPIATLFGTDGDDHLSAGANTIVIGGKGNDTISGAGPGANDTVVIDANFDDPSTQVRLSGGVVMVTTADGTDTLTGIDRIQFADKGLLIVDPTGQYGFSSVQAAVNAATAGDTIWVLPGTYTESTIPTGFSTTAGGLFIDTPNLTLQGVEADGMPIMSVTDANKDTLPLIISGAQTDFGSNIFIGPDADNTVIQGLHLQAGAETNNKLLEIWANNVTVENNFLDVNIGGTTYSGAIAVYFNDNGTPFTDQIASYTVANNILNEGIDISNGVGVPSPLPSPNQVISDNTFEGTFDISTGLGRYDTVVLNGQVPGIGWLLESTQVPTIIGNQFGDNTTPFLLRGSDISAGNLPTSTEVAAFLTANGNPDTTYAYVEKPNGDLELAARDFGSGPFFSFAVTNTIDTLELALEPAGDNTIFSGQSAYLQSGDTVIIQSGPNAVSSAIDVDGLLVQANQDSAALTLTLATALPDGTPVTVQSLSLLDYAAGQGANVNVVGNDLGDTIFGNHGDNVITTGSGNDSITGGGGNDTISSGGGDDLIIYNVADGGRETVDGGSGTDTQIVSNLNGSAETFNINPIDASHLGINIEPGVNNAVAATSGNYTISDTNVEEIGLHLGSSGDTVIVSGNLNGTGVLTSTITIDGGSGDDTVDASAIDPAYPVDVVFTGGGGNDNFIGGPGADTIIYNVTDGGTETVAGGAGIDTQIIDNTGGAAETFNINPIDASHLGVNIESGATVVPATTANSVISDTGVEEIVVKLGADGDDVVLSGDLSGTGVSSSTITIQGGAGDDTVDLSQLKSNNDVVYDGGGQADATGDTVIFGVAFAAANVTPIFDGSGHLIGLTVSYTSADGPVTDTITNVENFQFSDGTKTLGDLFPATVHPDAVAVADTANKDAGTIVAQGNAITDVGDAPGIGAGVTLDIAAVDGVAGNVGHDVAGAYGTLHLDANGGYTYTANAALDALTAGQTASDVFDVTVGSSNGGSVATTLTFDITGADDTPVNSVPGAQTIASPVKTLVFSSADGDAVSVSDADSSSLSVTLTVTHGTLTLHQETGLTTVSGDDSSTVTFSGTIGAIDAALDGLTYANTPGYSGSDTLQIVSDDGFRSDTDTIGITVIGNHAPMIQSFTNGSVTDDFSLTVTTSELVTNGGFENGLTGWTVVKSIPSDISGATSDHHSGAIGWDFETVTSSASNIVQFSQPINNTVAGVTYTISFWVAEAGTNGANSLDVLWNGSTALALNNVPATGGDNSFVEHSVSVIGTGQPATLEFDIHNLNAFIFDDISMTSVGITPGTETTNGTITFTDADIGDIHTISVAPNSNFGSFTASLGTESSGGSTGTVNWTFSATDAQISALVGAQQTVTETYAVTIDDGEGGDATQNISVTITNPDHAPTAVADSVAVNEDATAAATTRAAGVLHNDTDPDGDTLVVTSILAGTSGTASAVTTGGATLVHGTYGDLSINADGTYSYAPNNANAEALAQGQTANDSFTYTESDGHGGSASTTLTFNITGQNDPAVIGAPTVSSVTEDVNVDPSGNLTATGMISITDVDAGQNHFSTTVTPGSGDLGSLVLQSNGSYVYTVADSAVQFLAGSNAFGGTSTHVDTFTVTSADGTSQVVSFTINGANDAAVIGTPTVSSVTEDVNVVSGNLTASGMIPITDVDTGENHFNTTVASGSGNLGSLVLQANGSYTYTVADSAVQFLSGSTVDGGIASHVDTFTVTAADGTSQLVSFTINGVDDAPVNSVPGAQTVISPATLVLSSANGDALSVSDVDNSSLSVTLTVAHGALTLHQETGLTSVSGDDSSTVTFSGTIGAIDAALDGLTYAATSGFAGGDTLQIVSNDGQLSDTDTVGITVSGDHAPVIKSAPETGSVVDGFSSTVPLGQLVSDGGFEINALSPPWTVVDQAGDTATTTGGGHTGDDAGFLTATTNSGDVVKLSQVLNTVAGVPYTITFWFQSNSPVPGGSFSSLRVLWDGTSELFLQNMATAGNWVEETLNVIGTGQDTIQFNMQDRVTFIFLDDVSVQANIIPGTETTSGQITFTDQDVGDTHTVTVAPNTNVGTFTASLGTESSNNSTGTVNWTFSATDAQITALVGPQQSTTETYSVIINDGHGGVASQVVTVDISNPDHTPQVTSGAQTGSVTEGFSYSLNSTQLVADGGFESGTNDGLGNSWAATIHSSLGDVLGDQSPAQAGTQSLLLWTGSDAANDVIKLTQPVANTVAGVPYTLTFFATSGFGFDPNNFIHVIWNNQTVLSLTAIPEGDFSNFVEYSATLVGTGTTSTLEFDFQNTDAYAIDSVSLQASPPPGTEMASGVITFTDQDIDHHTVSVAPIAGASGYIGTLTASIGAESVAGTPGTVNWIYSVSDAAAASLAPGQSLMQTYVVTINDGHGGVTTQNVTVTINGATVTADGTPPTVTFTGDTLHTSPTADAFTGTIKDNATGTVTIQLFSGNSPSGTAVGGASTSVFVTGGAPAANWSISADTSLAKTNHTYVQATDAHGNVAIASRTLTPAGVSGEAVNLALTDYSDHTGMVSLTVAGLAAGWALSEGTQNADGSWTVQTNDIGALSVTSPDGYVGALVLNVSESWTNADGTHGTATVPDNVEAYAKGAPIFAWSGDDTLTASTGGNDTLVFANQIGADVVHNFDTAHDKIDLIGFSGFASFADVQSHLGHDASGNAVITLADGETITLTGVNAASLNAGDFEFNQTPVTNNTGDMVIGDGALLPLSGIVDNTGSIHISSAGSETDLEIVQHGATLQGGGTLVMSDNSENVIFGSDPSVTLTNVDNVISGAGQIGEGQMTLVNEGSIIADGTNALVIDTGVNTVINSGTLEATGAGGLTVHSDVANNGLLWANGGNITLDGDVSGMGSALISGNANLEVGGAFNEQVTFDNGSSGTLTLDHSSDFKGVLSGFGEHDSIDLGDIQGSTASLNYAENAAGTGGTLTVNDGAHTANIAFSGQYAAADFLVASDSANHALVQIEQHTHQMAAAA